MKKYLLVAVETAAVFFMPYMWHKNPEFALLGTFWGVFVWLLIVLIARIWRTLKKGFGFLIAIFKGAKNAAKSHNFSHNLQNIERRGRR